MCRFTRSSGFICFLIVLALTQNGIAGGKNKRVQKFFEDFNTKGYNKCGFHLLAHYFASPSADKSLKSLLQQRPTNDTSIVSSSGRFRIHFDTTGGSEPSLYNSSSQPIPNSSFAFADSVADICDHVYTIEVDTLGFPPPPSDSGAGGGYEYDVYVQSLPQGEYGYTDWDENRPIIDRTNATYATWMVIRNEFQTTYTRGIPALKVTVAHEFNHAIQVGNFGLWPNDIYFYELTSTWLEQVVYPGIRDYFQYLPNFFSNVDRPFNLYDPDNYAGYERCVFGIFVQNEYGSSVMVAIWNNIGREQVIPALEDQFNTAGPANVFLLFAQWNYFTSYRAGSAGSFGLSTYPLAAAYPLVSIAGFGTLSQSGVSFLESGQRLSEHFFQINDGPDTIGISVANTNFGAATVYDSTNFPFSVGISTGNSGCIRELSGGYCVFLSPSNTNYWKVLPVVSGSALAATNNLAFPQPFNPATQLLRVPYPFSNTVNASLSIYTISGDLIKRLTGDQTIDYYLRGKYFTWNGRDSSGRIVGSGVYIYVLSDGTNSAQGKIAVVRN